MPYLLLFILNPYFVFIMRNKDSHWPWSNYAIPYLNPLVRSSMKLWNLWFEQVKSCLDSKAVQENDFSTLFVNIQYLSNTTLNSHHGKHYCKKTRGMYKMEVESRCYFHQRSSVWNPCVYSNYYVLCAIHLTSVYQIKCDIVDIPSRVHWK